MSATPLDTAIADVALDTIAHRGPDDRGSWSDDGAWLGNRRLAILDVSAAGHQPMVDTSTGNVLTYNGEIYNYVELRRELERDGRSFRTGTDTEVVLAAYAAWGLRCLERFNGMWGFALWDARLRRLFFARDRFGVKPLYYALRDGRFVLASEPKAIIAFGHPAVVDTESLFRFLAHGELYGGERSFYDGIRIVPAGHCGSFAVGDATPALHRYWDETAETSEGDAVERFSELFEDAVRIRLRSDVPVGVTLSGGLDSTAVAHAAARQLDRRRLLAFHARGGETPWAERAAAWAPAELRAIGTEVDEWLPTMKRIAWHMDGPGYSPAVFPLWKIMAAARRDGVPVLLEGQGADELLGGYAQHAAAAIVEQLGRGELRRASVATREAAAAFQARSLFGWIVRSALPAATHTYRRRLGLRAILREDFVEAAGSPLPAPKVRGFEATRRRDFTRDVLPGLLHYGDAISMAHSIESRLPFLDYRLVQYCAGLAQRWKVADGETKVILRRYLRSVGAAELAGRKEKVGFVTPVNEWLAPAARALLLGADARIAAYVDRDGLERIFARAANGSAPAQNYVYRLISTEIWLRECVDDR